MGRNMFGPIRGEWDEGWRGWWGDEPPYHAPVFVLTHHAHEPIEMDGGTTFHFVTDGFDAAYAHAVAVAGEREVLIAGGASTVRQAFAACVIDELVPTSRRCYSAKARRCSRTSQTPGWSRST
jgi:dihydrofolate reductase